MIRKSVACFLCVFAFAVVAMAAADFNGKWEGSVKGPNGEDFPLVYTFAADGEKLTGTVSSSMGEAPISEGKIKGDEITFTVEFGDSKILHEGKMAGDVITIKSHAPWGDAEYALKRQAKKAS